MKKLLLSAIAILFVGFVSSPAAAQTLVACSRACWYPLVPTELGTLTCLMKITTQAGADGYNGLIKNGELNAGKQVIFQAMPNNDGVSCGPTTSYRAIAVLGRIVITLSNPGTSPAAVGETMSVVGNTSTVSYDYKNTLFFPDANQD
jgi:hypothetical protein